MDLKIRFQLKIQFFFRLGVELETDVKKVPEMKSTIEQLTEEIKELRKTVELNSTKYQRLATQQHHQAAGHGHLKVKVDGMKLNLRLPKEKILSHGVVTSCS